LSNIKGNNAILEEKLHSESLQSKQRGREAEEHKNLWESEVKSRSKLGVHVSGFVFTYLLHSLSSSVPSKWVVIQIQWHYF